MNTKAKIVIADDSSFMRKVLIDMLTEEGFTDLVECGTGKEVLAQVKIEKPDLILLDIVMPEMDGLEVLKEIGKEVDVIVVSAVGQDSMIKEAKQSGAKGYLVKPFEKTAVLAEVEKHLA